MNTAIDSLSAACDFVLSTLADHPERDECSAAAAALAGKRRRYACIYLAHVYDPADLDPCDDDWLPPPVSADPATPEGNLAAQAIGMLDPLRMLNPVNTCFGVDSGPGTLISSFGIPLNPQAQNSPAFHRTLAEVMAEDPPSPESSGLLPQIRERIELIKVATPPEFMIGMPDCQGPFNIAHGILGNEVFTAHLDDPALFQAFLARVTDFFIAVRRNLSQWIGPERLHPFGQIVRIADCSVNLVSTEHYNEHILPHDQRIASECGALHMHPCSGPHVFRATLEHLPLRVTEAGFIAQTAAGAITVDDALKAIGDRPITLIIGQELPPGNEYDLIRSDLDRYRAHPRLMFGYTGMHWRRKDRAMIRDIHRRLDEYWNQTRTREA